MVQLFNRNDASYEKAFNKASKKFKLNIEDIDLVIYDKLLFGLIFIMAISKKKIYLLSAENKNIEEFDIKDFDKFLIENKTDLNLCFKDGRVINLSSVVGVKGKVVAYIKNINEVINKLKY